MTNVNDIRIELDAGPSYGVAARCYLGDKKIMTIGMWTHDKVDLDATDFEGTTVREMYEKSVRSMLSKGEQLQLIPDTPGDPYVHQRPSW